MIKTWQQRCEEHPDHEGIVSEQMIRDRMQEEIDELRQALSEPEQEPYASQAAMVAHIADRIRIDPETGNVSIGTPAQAIDLQTTIERGTKAWADVPNASEWVNELRGNDTPEVTPEVPCKSDVDNSAHEAEDVHGNVDNVNMSEERVHKTDKFIHEWVGLTDEEIFQAYKPEMEGMPFNKFTLVVIAGYIEAKLREKNT